MPVTWQRLYADRAEGMRASDIREILKVTAQPDIISLAGGLPAPELFPIDEYRRAFEWVLESDGQDSPQSWRYGAGRKADVPWRVAGVQPVSGDLRRCADGRRRHACRRGR